MRVCVSDLDVGGVQVPEGAQGSRQVVGAAAHPQSLQHTGGHPRPLTLALGTQPRGQGSQVRGYRSGVRVQGLEFRFRHCDLGRQ